jgi:aminopeptidase N
VLRTIASSVFTILLSTPLVFSSLAENQSLSSYCDKTGLFADHSEKNSTRKYAPSRQIDILHQTLDVTPDFDRHGVSGQVRIEFKPIAKPFGELHLNAVDLSISQVEASVPILAWNNTGEELVITFRDTIPPDAPAWAKVSFKVEEPREGLYFRTPSMGYKPGDMHLWTQGEMHEARHWFPSYDYPNEKFTTEMICHVKEGMVALSNGRLISHSPDPGTGLVSWHWKQEKPHANYLITLCAGYFSKIEDRAGDVPLAFWTPQSQIAFAKNAFAGTADMVRFFEKETGVKYPWHRYDQVVVDDFTWGGMENTSQTTLVANGTLYPDEFIGTRTNSSNGLVAHELAHQWFGDYVTAKDWSHTWLNEGFATFYDALYVEHSKGRDDFLYQMWENAQSLLGPENDRAPIVFRGYKDAVEQFGAQSYQKGSWVLHMLRSQLGADLYRQCVQSHLEAHALGNATTEEFIAIIERLSGRDWDQFFDQYVFHPHHPELRVDYSWEDRRKLARISIQQVQKLDPNVLLFKLPLKIRFKTGTTQTDVLAHVSQASEDFTFPLSARPEIVRIDPDYSWLADVEFSPSQEMVQAQLNDKTDVIGRIFAVEQIAKKADKNSIELLQKTLNTDPFWGVRLHAARKLREIHDDDARSALLASIQQPDERVRRDVIDSLGSFFRQDTPVILRKFIASEKNPDLQSTAIRALGSYPVDQVRDELLVQLKSDSFDQILAGAAIAAIRQQRHPAYIEPLLSALQQRESEFPTHTFADGLGTLAEIASEKQDRTAIRELLISKLNDPKRRVRDSAIRALGVLGDPQAIAPLTTIANAGKATRSRDAAEEAIRKLRERKPASAEIETLRTEVLDLQKSNREMKQQLDDLKKRFDSERLSTTNSPSNSRKKSASAK